MSVRHLSGQRYHGFEIVLDVLHEPKELTREIRRLLEEYPNFHVQSLSLSCDPYDEDLFVYSLVLAG